MMAHITAQMVKDLRERTDLPMMECKHALAECDGDFETAKEWLRKKYKGKMADRADRPTGEGRISICIDQARKVGGIVQLLCETTPVAKNDLFVNLANAFAEHVVSGSQVSPDPEKIRQHPALDVMFTDVFGRLREAMKLASCSRVEGAYLGSYVHHDGKSGVLIALSQQPKSDKNIAADLCMHALFTNPAAIDRTGVSAEAVEKVRVQAREMALAEGKKDAIVEKIVEGKVAAFYGQCVLMEQLHVKTDDYGKTKVGQVLKDAGVDAVTDLVIMKVGQ